MINLLNLNPWETPNLYSLLDSKVVYFYSVFTLGAKVEFTDPSGVLETARLFTDRLLQLTAKT